ncbi:hypothetical protein AB0M80_28575 [Amycolatopsis sp. NPDC051045]|uniref:hypothetical protein n=1 Tax=Amycolatopsis sp. NPDC051045 TaxID=3156922 RepID=UPI00342CF036
MIEPLYVDQARLDEYYSQVVTKPKVRRVPTYTISAGLSPSVGLQGAVTQVPVGLAEKLETVCAYLGGQDVLGLTRPSIHDSWDNASPDPDLPEPVWTELRRTFRRETCEVRSLLLPPPDGAAAGTKGLALWISARPLELETGTGGDREIGALYLLPNFPEPDGPARYVSGLSLLAMLYELELPRLAAGLEQFADDSGRRPCRGTRNTRGARLQDLVELGKWGPPKMVDVLYRIRASFMDSDDDFRVTTIAYPIAMLRA